VKLGGKPGMVAGMAAPLALALVWLIPDGD